MSPFHPRKNYASDPADDSRGDGPKIKISGSGYMRDWIFGAMLLISLIKSFMPKTENTDAIKAETEARIAPIMAAIADFRTAVTDLKTMIADLDKTTALEGQTVAAHSLELADHEERIRVFEQGTRAAGSASLGGSISPTATGH